MFITFIKEWAQFRAASPASSASTTPGAAGNVLVIYGQNESAGVITPSAAAGTQVNPPALVLDGVGDSHAISVNLSLTAGAQVATLTGASGAQTMEGEGVEYSGVGNRSNGASVTRTNPGNGAGAIAGPAVTVAIGDVLVVNVKCVTAITSNPILCVGGTIRGHSENNSPFVTYVTAEYAGTGGSITPTFTDGTNGSSQTYEVSQVVLNASGGGGSNFYPTDIDERPRPGRGPYSLGLYFRPSIDATWARNSGLAIDSPGAITLAGQALSLGMGIPLVGGAVSIAGQAFSFSQNLPVANGNVTLAGQSIAFNRNLPLSNGAITINGQSMTLINGGSLVIDTAGAIGLAGQSVSLSLSGPIAMTINVPGAITITGQNVALSNGDTEGLIQVPLFVGMFLTDAAQQASDLGFTNIRAYQQISTRFQGIVIAQNQTYGSFVLPGIDLALVVAEGSVPSNTIDERLIPP